MKKRIVLIVIIMLSVWQPAFSAKQIPSLSNQLCLLEKPFLNKPVKLIYKFKPIGHDVVNAKAEINLPDNFLLLSGSLIWQGDLKADEQQNIEVVVVIDKPGYYHIGAYFKAPTYGTIGYNMYFEVTKKGVITGARGDDKYNLIDSGWPANFK